MNKKTRELDGLSVCITLKVIEAISLNLDAPLIEFTKCAV